MSVEERELDGTTTLYDEVDVGGDRIERLMTEIFGSHWAEVTVGPLTLLRVSAALTLDGGLEPFAGLMK